jgi:pyruvate dehydrogenase E2 component (dihydrolipoamide acetyltransferase)
MSKRWERLNEYSSWRKIAMGMWDKPNDPTIYGRETVDVSNLIPYLEEISDITGVHVTPTAYCVKMMADILAEHPDLNVLPIGNHIYQRDDINVFCQVAIPNDSAGSADLSGVTVRNTDELDVVDIARILGSKASDVRDGRDVEMESSKSMVDYIPNGLLSVMLDVLDFLTFRVPVDLDMLGIRSDPFGSCMVTSVGQFDIEQGFAPLLPGSHCPLICLPGKVWEAPFVKDGEVVPRKAITMSCTFDHRCYDGLQIGYIVRGMRTRLMHPTDHFPEPSHWRDQTDSSADATATESTEESPDASEGAAAE